MVIEANGDTDIVHVYGGTKNRSISTLLGTIKGDVLVVNGNSWTINKNNDYLMVGTAEYHKIRD
jgi:hypothetical protein